MSAANSGILDYGLIGNCRTAGLVSRRGSLDWACFPRFDSSSLFAAILDPELGGNFGIEPLDPYESEQRYVEDTAVLETWFRTRSGRAVLRDAFVVEEGKDGLAPQHEILRVVQGVEGETHLRLELAPRSDFGRTPVELRRIGTWGIGCARGRKLLLLRSDLPDEGIRIAADGVRATFTVPAGRSIAFSLVYSDTAPAPIPPMGEHALSRLEATFRYWKLWSARTSYRGEYEREVKRSALTLKLLTFAPSGAIVAAPTASLPEALGRERNWDYRYCWLRDAAFTVRGLASLGYHDEARAYLGWLLHATRLTHPELQIVYSVYGESRLKERVLRHLLGYRNSRPVRIGNGAWDQFQLDVYGEVLDAAKLLLPESGVIDRVTRDFLIGLGQAVSRLWDRPDDGIWEVRSGKAHHTHSKVMAWVALDRIRQLCKDHSWTLPPGILQSQAEIRNAIERDGYNVKLGAYTRTFGRPELDASLLTLPLVGYLPAESPRMQGTIRAIQKSLMSRGLVYRYAPRSDGFGSKEGAFVLCNFWLAEALARSGRLQESRRAIDAVLRRMNPLMLLPEELDPDTGEYLGNYPQAFSHVGLINAAVTLSRCQEGRNAA